MKRETHGLCVHLCLLIFLVSGWIPWDGDWMYISVQKFYREKVKEAGLVKELNLAAVESQKGLSWPLRDALKLRWLFRVVTSWGEWAGSLFPGIDEFLDMICPEKEVCFGVRNFQQMQFQQTILPTTKGINTSVFKRGLGGTGLSF